MRDCPLTKSWRSAILSPTQEREAKEKEKEKEQKSVQTNGENENKNVFFLEIREKTEKLFDLSLYIKEKIERLFLSQTSDSSSSQKCVFPSFYSCYFGKNWEYFVGKVLSYERTLQFVSESRQELLLNHYTIENKKCFKGETWISSYPVSKGQIFAPLDEKSQIEEISISAKITDPKLKDSFFIPQTKSYDCEKKEEGEGEKQNRLSVSNLNLYETLIITADSQGFYMWRGLYFSIPPLWVIVKFNRHIPLGWEQALSVSPDPAHCWDHSKYWGASFYAFLKLANYKNYKFVSMDSTGTYILFCYNVGNLYHETLENLKKNHQQEGALGGSVFLLNYGNIEANKTCLRKNFIQWRRDFLHRPFFDLTSISIPTERLFDWRQKIHLHLKKDQQQTQLKKVITTYRKDLKNFKKQEKELLGQVQKALFPKTLKTNDDDATALVVKVMIANVYFHEYKLLYGMSMFA